MRLKVANANEFGQLEWWQPSKHVALGLNIIFSSNIVVEYFITSTNWCHFPLSILLEGHCGHVSWTEFGNPSAAPIYFSHWGWKSAHSGGTSCQSGKPQIARSCALSCGVWTGRRSCSGSRDLWSWRISGPSTQSCSPDLHRINNRELSREVRCQSVSSLLRHNSFTFFWQEWLECAFKSSRSDRQVL